MFYFIGGELKKLWTVYFPKEGTSKLRNNMSETEDSQRVVSIGVAKTLPHYTTTLETPNPDRELTKGFPRYRHLS